jgi:DNA-binding MarR family transcriptional regulator
MRTARLPRNEFSVSGALDCLGRNYYCFEYYEYEYFVGEEMMKELHILELLGEIYRRVIRTVAPLAEEEGLSMTDMLVVWKMRSRECCRVKELVAEIGLPPSTLTGILDRLTEAGWLAREADPDDRRAVVVRRTEKLDKFAHVLLKERTKILVAAFGKLPRDLLDRLNADLTAVHELLQAEERRNE